MPAPAGGLSATRFNQAADTALCSLLQLFDVKAGVLFAQSEPNHSDFAIAAHVSTTGRPPDLSIQCQCLLPRWIRVNQQALPIPDSIGIIDAVESPDRAALDMLGVTLAVPLLVDTDLVAWAGLPSEIGRDGNPFEPPAEVAAIALRFRDERNAAVARSRVEAADRSNRLGVAGQMAAGIAHEIRNPLAAVRSMVQLVQGDVAPPSDRNRLLDTVLAEIDRINRALSGLMSLGRPATSRSDRVDIASVVTEATEFCRAYAKQKQQTLDVLTTETLTVLGDQHELRQVVVNLVMNACQATGTSKTISIEAKSKVRDDGAPLAVVRIMDPGHGIPPTQLSQVFEPFYTTKPDGGGLGLALCREAVRRHGGDIAISSEVDVGTTVSIEFPLLISDVPNLSR